MNLSSYSLFFTIVKDQDEDPTPYIIAQGIKKEQREEFIKQCQCGVKPESATVYYDKHITSYLNEFIDPVNQASKNKYYEEKEKTDKPIEYRKKAEAFSKKSKKIFTALIIFSIAIVIVGLQL